MPLEHFLLRVFKLPRHPCEDTKKIAPTPSLYIPVIKNIDKVTCSTSPWIQSWHVAARIIAIYLVPIVNTIFFLDVFLTFFTGELTSSGTLVPKPFFTRYIFPGVGLQLVVNPTMIQMRRLAQQIIESVIYVGPSLFFHLLLVSIPFMMSCRDCLLDVVLDLLTGRT